MPSANDFIRGALGQLGVLALGEQVDGDVAADALTTLNNLIDSWNLDRLYILAAQDNVLTVAPGTASVTVGQGGNINVARPVKIEDRAFFRFTNLDFTMQQIDLATFNEIVLKQLQTTYPAYYYYDAAYPLGTVKFWPVPIQSCELHLPLQVQLTQFADLTTNYAFAPGYARLISLGLAVELSPNYRPASPDLLRAFANASRLVRRMNFRVPLLESPPWIRRGDDRRPNGLANFLAGI